VVTVDLKTFECRDIIREGYCANDAMSHCSEQQKNNGILTLVSQRADFRIVVPGGLQGGNHEQRYRSSFSARANRIDEIRARRCNGDAAGSEADVFHES
jgi:hypothetical protein